ncbi:MAG: hypothetical protein V4665_01520 [Patescibacteria group bacterium]
MGKIQSCLVEDQHTFEFYIEGITVSKLKTYCEYADLSLKSLKINDTYQIPGHYFLGLLRSIIPKIAAKDPEMPIVELESWWNMSINEDFENKIFTHQAIDLKMQIKTKAKKRVCFWVEFIREKDKEVVLSGLFSFIGKHR